MRNQGFWAALNMAKGNLTDEGYLEECPEIVSETNKFLFLGALIKGLRSMDSSGKTWATLLPCAANSMDREGVRRRPVRRANTRYEVDKGILRKNTFHKLITSMFENHILSYDIASFIVRGNSKLDTTDVDWETL